MSSETKHPPVRSPVVSDEELIEAVQAACKQSSIPVAPTGEVADMEWVEIQQSRVKRRLEKIDEVSGYDTGGAFVWWIPEEEDRRGTIDPSSTYWDGFDPEEIPSELIEAHPEYPSQAERVKEKGNAMVGPAGLLFLFGIGIYVGYEYGMVEPGSNLELAGMLALVAGFTFMLLGMGVAIIGEIGAKLESYGAFRPIRSALAAGCRRIEDRLPVSWDRDNE